jgi:hypothetical protein
VRTSPDDLDIANKGRAPVERKSVFLAQSYGN